MKDQGQRLKATPMLSTGWQDRAACAERYDLFFTDDNEKWTKAEIAEAKSICARCPVREECLRYANRMDENQPQPGIWGGLTPLERSKYRNGRLKITPEGVPIPRCRKDLHDLTPDNTRRTPFDKKRSCLACWEMNRAARQASVRATRARKRAEKKRAKPKAPKPKAPKPVTTTCSYCGATRTFSTKIDSGLRCSCALSSPHVHFFCACGARWVVEDPSSLRVAPVV